MRGALRSDDAPSLLRRGERAVALDLASGSAPDTRLLRRGRFVDVVILGPDGSRVAARGLELLVACQRALGWHLGDAARAVRGRTCPGDRPARTRRAAALARRRLVIVRLALLGGDAALAEELRAALAGLPEIALLAPGSRGRCRHAAGRRLVASQRPATSCAASVLGARRRAILLVARQGSESAAQQALDCGAVGRRRTADRRSGPASGSRGSGLRSTRALDARHSGDEGHVALIGAGGGMGTTTCAVALAAARRACLRARSGAGDGRCRRGRSRARGRAGCAPADRLRARRSAGGARGRARARRRCRVLPAPAAARARRSDRRAGASRACSISPSRAGCARSSTAARGSESRRFRCSSARASSSSSRARMRAEPAARGAQSLLIARLGLSARLAGIVATGSRKPQRRAGARRADRACRCSRP